jgi:small-conductance mechanosensitive channel
MAVAAETRRRIATTEQLLDALGPAPTPNGDGMPEAAPVAEQRRELQATLADLRSRLALAEVTATRAEALLTELSALGRQELFERFTRRLPVPVAPDTIGVAVPEFVQAMRQLLESPVDWYRRLPESQRTLETFLPSILFLTAALALGWLVRSFLLRRFGQDPRVSQPTYARRFLAAVVEAVARGIVPASLFGVMYLRVAGGDTPLTGDFAHVIRSICIVMFFYLLVVSTPRAVLAPEHPDWRLTALPPRNTRILSRRLVVLATIMSVAWFLERVGRDYQPSPELLSLFEFATKSLMAVWVILLAQGRLWQVPSAPAQAGAPAPQGPSRLWGFVRVAIMLLAAFAIAALLVGYTYLGDYLIRAVVATGIVIGFLLLVRGLLRESVGFLLRSQLVTERLAVGPRLRQRIKFALRAALDPLLLLLGVLALAPVWGVPWADLQRWVGAVLVSFTVGNVTISIVDIVLGLTAFIVALTLVRAIQRSLQERILPEMELQPGVQHSLAAGAGYVGLLVAIGLAVSVAGFDLTTLALVAGGLSLGIGIGLQGVVNNFVSGFIMLIERPVNVGDWVVVGQNEGFVKKINIRATEIETWQRATVIVPNADFINLPVTNWTLVDNYGRIEVRVHVARGVNTLRVRDILLQVANEHPKVVMDPEPFVLFQDFNPSSLEFELRCYTNDVVWKLTIASDIRYEIDRRFRAEPIEVPFPHQVVHLRNGADGEGVRPETEKMPRTSAGTIGVGGD